MANEHEPITPERVARVFEEAGYEVMQAVGDAPGTVDWFATRRTGFDRGKTYIEVWPSGPGVEGVAAAIEKLDERRRARKAERALAVVPTGSLPAGYRTELTGRTAEVVTWKRLVLELSGFVDLVRRQVAEYASQGIERYYVPRRLQQEGGEPVDALKCIREWLGRGPSTTLHIAAKEEQELRSILRMAFYDSARAWLRDPEAAPLLCGRTIRASVPQDVDGFVVPINCHDTDGPALIAPYDMYDDSRVIERYELLWDEPDSVESWFTSRIDDDDLRRRFVDARAREPSFRELSGNVFNASALLKVLEAVDADLVRLEGPEWIVLVVHRYVSSLIESGTKLRLKLTLWEDAALEQFALDCAPRRFSEEPEEERRKNISLGLGEEMSWLGGLDQYPEEPFFANPLIHHYFIARKIAADPGILTRHQFPREYVLLFLAFISPEAASIATADRSEEVRKEIEDQVERRLQLTLGHQLRRSAGAIRSQFNTLKKRLRPEELGALEYEIRRIDEEIDYQRALAEQTRRWHEVPEAAITSIIVREVAEASLERIAAQFPAITRTLDVDVSIRVRASRDVLQEILDSLIENAFQAIAFGPGTVTPRVVVRARPEGDTVRIDVIDNGPGVSPTDRGRIFDLYVSTKKGGDKPLGTGMGLPIARRYAQHVGGMVDIDPDHADGACFFARFVAWKEPA